MIRSFLLLATATLSPLMALDNTITVYSLSGSAQTNRVVAIARFFAQAEMPSGCVTAYVSGSPISTQTDPKAYWPDGSLKHAAVSFEVASVPSGGVAVEFRDSSGCNNTGYIPFNELASGGSVSWGAQLETTANGLTQIRNAQAMLDACGSISTNPFASTCRYWKKGALVTEVIIEDRSSSRSQDFGYQYSGSSWQIPTSATHHSLHPIFVISFQTPSTGSPYVHVQTIVENVWADRIQRQAYSIDIKTGSPLTTAFSRATEWSHIARSRWRVDRWSGSQPGDIFVDFNLPYLIHTKAIPQYDLGSEVTVGDLDTMLTSYNTLLGTEEPTFCPTTADYCGLVLKRMPNTGARSDIALLPKWFTLYLKSMGNPAIPLTKRKEVYDKLLMGNALGVAGAGHHYREYLTNRCADESGATKFVTSSGCTQNAFGLPISLNARPTFRAGPPGTWETSSVDSTADDVLSAWLCNAGECAASTTNGWDAAGDTARAHAPGINYLPYLITGDAYFLDELQFWAAGHMFNTHPVARVGSWGFLNYGSNERYWVIRDLGHAAFITPDAHPLKNYFAQKFRRNMAVEEGAFSITNGLYYNPATTSSWYWGWNTLAARKPNPLALTNRAGGATGPAGCDGCDGWDLTKALVGNRRYYLSYRNVIYGHLAELLPEAVPVAEWIQKGLVSLVIDDGKLAYQNAAYTWPYKDRNANWFTTPSALRDAMALDCTLNADILSPTATSFQCRTDQSAYLSNGVDSFQIDNERIRVCLNPVRTVSGTNFLYNYTVGTAVSCPSPSVLGRGFQGTLSATHTAGTPVVRTFSFFEMTTDTVGSYMFLLRGSLAFTVKPSIPNSRRAWNWMEQTTVNAGMLKNNPMWNFVPRDQITGITIAPSSDGAILRFDAPAHTSVCSAVVGLSPPSSSLSTLDQPLASGSRARQWVITGLQPGLQYFGRLTCGTARVPIQFVTANSSSLVTSQMKFGTSPPGATQLLLEVSSSSNMTAPTSNQVTCLSGCTLSLAGLTSGTVYYARHTWLSALGNTMAISKPVPFVAQ